MNLENLKLRTLIFSISGFLLVMLLITAGVAITKMNNIGEELKEVTEEDMVLIQAITEITENQLEQAIWFERALPKAISV